MKLKKLMKKLNVFLHAEEKLLHDKDKALAEVLKKLKKKEMKLQQSIDLEEDEAERKLLEQELKIVHSQREKGIGLLSGLRGRGDEPDSKE